ncbi:hypothetical protein ACHAWO_012136 [Cyclotella atomus]|uniref:PiggyBac transposable element-derived protein domain-containing protein n=1 Tax=Cyclotella atomus TaxID=382360 RepID=A0ABD3PUA4_9STRA
MCHRKPHPNGNEYHSITDGDDEHPVMWRIKIQEGKDRPKDATGKWAFPSKFDGTNAKGRAYTKTSTLMCEMTEPIHGTGKIVSMDSGFCVTAGILHLHDLGVYGQGAHQTQVLAEGCAGVTRLISTLMVSRSVSPKTLKQDMDGIPFYVHCNRDTKFVTKMMSTHGLLTTVRDHITYRQKPSGRSSTCQSNLMEDADDEDAQSELDEWDLYDGGEEHAYHQHESTGRRGVPNRFKYKFGNYLGNYYLGFLHEDVRQETYVRSQNRRSTFRSHFQGATGAVDHLTDMFISREWSQED